MKYCEQCKVSVTGQRSRCPLCQSVLRDEGEPYEEVFPVIPTVYNRFQFFFKLLIFASAVLGIVSAVINLLLPQSGVWSLFVLGGIGCLWVFLFIAVRKRNNIPKNILWQVAVTILFCLLWDLFTGWHGWSVDYVVPSICVAAMAALAVTAKVFRLVVGGLSLLPAHQRPLRHPAGHLHPAGVGAGALPVPHLRGVQPGLPGGGPDFPGGKHEAGVAAADAPVVRLLTLRSGRGGTAG